MRLATLLSLLAVGSIASAAIVTKKVSYTSQGVELEGILAYDDAIKTARPGIMIIHDWDGITAYEESRAKQLAELGFVAFAADIYGKANRPKNMAENGQQAGKYRGDLPLYRARLAAGLEQLKGFSQTDKAKTAAIGYCFGGSGVLEIARSGMDVKGVVSFHGGLSSSMPATDGSVKSKVMVVHAAQDPSVPRAQFDAFLTEMQNAKVDYQTIVYNLNVHPFTAPGPSYNADADRRSWAAMRAFFAEIFG